MYFWKYKELALALRNNTVTRKQFIIYQVIFWIQVLLSLPALLLPSIRLYFLECVGTWLAITYAANRCGDGKDYYKRIICLDLPITIRVMAVYFGVGILGSIGLAAIHRPDMASPLGIAVDVVYMIYYLVTFINALGITSEQKS
jgi:hypothetical protein